MTLANKITFIRLGLTGPFFILLFFTKTDFYSFSFKSAVISTFVVITFIIISLMDILDGHIARKHNQETNLGKILDPIADKVFLCGIMLILNIFAGFPLWALLIIASREVLITVIRFFYVKKQKLVIPASLLGKLKTTITSVTLGFYVAPLQYMPSVFSITAFCLICVSVILTIVSLVAYILSISSLRET